MLKGSVDEREKGEKKIVTFEKSKTLEISECDNKEGDSELTWIRNQQSKKKQKKVNLNLLYVHFTFDVENKSHQQSGW